VLCHCHLGDVVGANTEFQRIQGATLPLWSWVRKILQHKLYFSNTVSGDTFGAIISLKLCVVI
jgi:hypothetical protein